MRLYKLKFDELEEKGEMMEKEKFKQEKEMMDEKIKDWETSIAKFNKLNDVLEIDCGGFQV